MARQLYVSFMAASEELQTSLDSCKISGLAKNMAVLEEAREELENKHLADDLAKNVQAVKECKMKLESILADPALFRPKKGTCFDNEKCFEAAFAWYGNRASTNLRQAEGKTTEMQKMLTGLLDTVSTLLEEINSTTVATTMVVKPQINQLVDLPDALFQIAEKLQNGNSTNAYLPKEVRGAAVLVKLDGDRWKVTNEHLKSPNSYIAYRQSMDMEDRVKEGVKVAEYEAILDGCDVGNGWVWFRVPAKEESPSRNREVLASVDLDPVNQSIDISPTYEPLDSLVAMQAKLGPVIANVCDAVHKLAQFQEDIPAQIRKAFDITGCIPLNLLAPASLSDLLKELETVKKVDLGFLLNELVNFQTKLGSLDVESVRTRLEDFSNTAQKQKDQLTEEIDKTPLATYVMDPDDKWEKQSSTPADSVVRQLSIRAQENVASFTGKDKYQIGDITKTVVRKMRRSLTPGGARDGGLMPPRISEQRSKATTVE